MDRTVAIDVSRLCKTYDGHKAVDDLSFQVYAGEIFSLLGPNGAGKSTTLKLLMQLIFPTGGHARILGKPVGDMSVRKRIGFLAENPYYYDYLTAEEVLTYFARLFGFNDVTARVSRVLDEVGIAGERRLRLRQFSKGMLQRVGLAQAILNDPDVVFLDEPMSGLDPLGRRQVRDLILRLRARGCTVFFSSHILSDAEALCSQVGIVAQGRLMALGQLADMVAFELRGWELVVANVPDTTKAKLHGRASLTTLANRHYTIELPPHEAPDQWIQTLAADGVEVVSLNPIRTTLEDYFVSMVSAASPRDAGRTEGR